MPERRQKTPQKTWAFLRKFPKDVKLKRKILLRKTEFLEILIEILQNYYRKNGTKSERKNL